MQMNGKVIVKLWHAGLLDNEKCKLTITNQSSMNKDQCPAFRQHWKLT